MVPSSVGVAVPTADAFLDTIPEDQSVAQQRVQNLSAASAVASSDSDDDNDEEAETTNPKRKRRPARRKGPGSVASSNNAIIDTNDTGIEVKPRDGSGRKPGSSCTKRSVLCWSIGFLMLLALCVGVFFIVSNTDRGNEKKASEATSPSLEPTPELTFPPELYFNLESQAPTPSPSINLDDIAAIDRVLLQITREEDYTNPNTPQGLCRYWMTRSDTLQVRVSTGGEEAVKQRYILCVLYHATKGDGWVETAKPFLDPNLHECDWKDVGCDDADHVALLYLAESNLQGSIPSELIHLSGLQLLNLGENTLTGSIPDGLLELPELILIDLSSNELTGTIPSTATSPTTLSRYSPLEVLYLDGNQLEGTIPFFDTLVRMRAQQNFFTGFDAGYATLQSLESWKMYDNNIRGPLPALWDAPNLSYVDLSLNQWTGTIPASLWNLPALQSLVLHDAQLTGTLPPSTVSNDWRYLWLHSNRLSGSIPPTFASSWTNVTEILLHDNNFTGTVLEESCNQWQQIRRLETDCDRTSLSCSCCTVCHS